MQIFDKKFPWRASEKSVKLWVLPKKNIHSHFFQFAPPFFPDIVCAEFLPTLNSSNKVFWKVACCRVIVCSVKSRFPNIGSFGKDCKDNFYESIGWKCSFYVTNRIKLSVFLYHMFFLHFKSFFDYFLIQDCL